MTGLAALLVLAAAVPVPTPTAHFNDWAGFVPVPAAQRLDRKLAAYRQATGHHVVVAIFPSLPEPDMEGFTVRTAQAWGVGRGGRIDDGVVLFVFAADRKLRIEVGYGLEASIPDIVAKRIIERVIVPRLKSGQRVAALDDGIEALMRAASGRSAGAAAGAAPTTAASPTQAAPRVVPAAPPPARRRGGRNDDFHGVLAIPAALIALATIAFRRAQTETRAGIPGLWAMGLVALTTAFFVVLYFSVDVAARLAAAVAAVGLIQLGRKGTTDPKKAGRTWIPVWLTGGGLLMGVAAVAPPLAWAGWSVRSLTTFVLLSGLLALGAGSTRYWWVRLLCFGEMAALALTFWAEALIFSLFVWPPIWIAVGAFGVTLFLNLFGLKPERWWLPQASSGGGGYSSSGYSRSSGSSYSSSSSSSSSSYSGGGGRFGGGGASGSW